MTESDSQQYLRRLSDLKSKYCGQLDDNGFRTGAGCEQWFNKNHSQTYSGEFVNNNVHGNGIYLIDAKGDQTYFDGSFYANKLEGYGKIIYSDGRIFEGLFKQHTRFGPGVLTYPDNTQDVGLWDGFFLMRLSVAVGDDLVPRLGQSSLGKARLLKFRMLVPVCLEPRDRAVEMLDDLEADLEVLMQSHELYNLHVRNPESIFFNQTIYNEKFFKEQDCTIEVIVTEEEFLTDANLELNAQNLANLEFVGEDDINLEGKKADSSCTCFQSNADKLSNMCTQLYDVEIKLQELAAKIETTEEKIQKCKECCQYMTLMEIPDANRQVNERVESTLVLINTLSSKILSCITLPAHSPASAETLQNYLTANSEPILEEEDGFYGPNKRFRRVTLPFLFVPTVKFSATTFRSSAIRQSEIQSDVSVDAFLKAAATQTCFCKDNLIENYDVLLETLDTCKKEQIFYETIKKSLTNHIDVEFQKLNELRPEHAKFVKKIKISHLMAWNNEEKWIQMLQFCFRHRQSENNVSFFVGDLLTAHRNSFKEPGEYERGCINFLIDCFEGRHLSAFNNLRTWNINPDLCDVRGNTGMMLASATDQANVIEVLVNCGGKVDAINDEGLTPLTMSLINYLSIQHKVRDWEKAFLEEPKLDKDDLINIRQWRPIASFLNVTGQQTQGAKQLQNDKDESGYNLEQSMSNQISKPTAEPDVTINQEQKYIFDMSFITAPRPKADKGKKKKRKRRKKRQKSRDKSTKASKKTKKTKKTKKRKTNGTESPINNKDDRQQSEEGKVEYNDEELRMLEKKKNTIITLLSYGADPNIGEVPLKPIFLATFTNDVCFINGLLDNGADPNAVTPDENLTPLHVIASLKLSDEKVKMCEVLLSYGANPNKRTNPRHWPEVRKFCIGRNPPEVNLIDEGKNVLHLLCLREDFVDDHHNYFPTLATMLIRSGCKTNDFYFGHTPLSLAVLRGNLKLIEALLKSKRVDPHHPLGNDMGNALTVLILKRFASEINYEDGKETALCLLDNGLNPFNNVGDYENVIAFMENENRKLEKLKVRKRKKRGKKWKKSKKGSVKTKKSRSTRTRTITTKTKRSRKRKFRGKPSTIKSKRSKRKSKRPKDNLNRYIEQETRRILCRHLQCKAVEHLYTLMTETMFADPLIVMLARFVEPRDILYYIDLLFQTRMIEEAKFSYVVIEDLMGFVMTEHKLELNEEELQKLINTKRWSPDITRNPKDIHLPVPEVDRDVDKYKVCFHCLTGSGKKLLACPSCELVYFCSQRCNELSVNSQSCHKCVDLFYDDFAHILGDEAQPSRLAVLLKMADKVRNERLAMFKLIDIQDKINAVKYVSAATRRKAERLLMEFKELKKEKEEFGKANIMWDYHHIHNQGEEEDKKESSAVEKYHEINYGRSRLDTAIFPELFPHVYRAYFDILRKTTSYGDEILLNIPKFTNGGGVIGPNVQSYSTQNQNPSIPAKDRGSVSSKTPGFLPKPRRLSNFNQKRTTSMTQTLRRSSLQKYENSLGIPKLEKLVDMDRQRTTDRMDRDSKALDHVRYFKKADKGYYMTLLSKIFADFNLPLLLLPYACFRDGQVYYSMSGNIHFGKSFQKLHLPD